MNERTPIRILYRNHRGETRARRILPHEIYYGTSNYHNGEQWLLVAFDIDKDDFRTFAMKDIHSWDYGPRRPTRAGEAAMHPDWGGCGVRYDRVTRRQVGL